MLDWAGLDPKRLERVVQMLVHDACGATSIDGSGGDGAQDLRSEDADGVTVYEVKSFAKRLTSAQKRQIKDSCLRAVRLQTPRRWVLVIPLNRSPAEAVWFDVLRAEIPGVELEWWGLDWLDGRIAGREDLISYVQGPDYQLLRRAGHHGLERSAVATGVDLARRVGDLLRVGNDISPYWRWQFEETPRGLGRVLRPRRPDSHTADPVQITPQFTFPPDDPHAQEVAQQLQEVIKFGGSVEVPGRFVERVQVTTASEATRRLIGDEDQPVGSLQWTSIPNMTGLPLRGELVLESPDGERRASVPFTLHSRVVGTNGVTVSGTDPSGLLTSRLRTDTTSRPELWINLNLKSPVGAYPQDVLPATRLLASFRPGDRLTFRVGPEDVASFLATAEPAESLTMVHRLVAALNVLQEHIGTLIPIDVPPTAADHHDLLAIADALRGQPARPHFTRLTVTVPAECLEHLLATVPETPAQLRLGSGDYTIALGDRECAVPGLALWVPNAVLTNRAELASKTTEKTMEYEAHFESHEGKQFFFVRDIDADTAPPGQRALMTGTTTDCSQPESSRQCKPASDRRRLVAG